MDTFKFVLMDNWEKNDIIFLMSNLVNYRTLVFASVDLAFGLMTIHLFIGFKQNLRSTHLLERPY